MNYNFVVDYFFYVKSFRVQNVCFNLLYFLNSNFYNFETTLDVDLDKMKVAGVDKVYNFVVDMFFIWSHLES